MKRFIPHIVLILAAAWVCSKWRVPSAEAEDFDTRAFGQLPVLSGGRIKPLDTVARTSLLIMRAKQSVRYERDGKRHHISATRWFADVLFNDAVADQYPVFTVHNQEVLGMLELPQADKRECTYAELKPHMAQIDEEGRHAAETEAAKRTPFQTAVFNLRNALILYQRLKCAVHAEGTRDFSAEVKRYAADGGAGKLDGGADRGLSAETIQSLKQAVARYERQSQNTDLLMVPPPAGGKVGDWLKTGDALIRVDSPASLPSAVLAYAEMGDALRNQDRAVFATVCREYLEWVSVEHPDWLSKSRFEWHFNWMEPFYQSTILYVCVFLLAAASWLMCPVGLRKTAWMLLVLALLVHSFGMFSRMYLQGRPPVTNLYSSAVFVGWGAVLIGMVIEKFFRDGIGAATSGLIGFATLIIAHHLGSNGDTLEMMQAVLDSNIWLATHVVVITFGYSAMFLAGFIGVVYVLLGLLTRLLNRERARSLSGMVYGVTCFATLFSFVGTVLGGIWADQSWGRFWGWDPKENGALLIVLWCGLMLHGRWAGMIRQRGLIAMAVFGNAITAFSWFGVNMLGVGLHSYGFMDKAFPWLLGFVIAQGVLVLLTQLPQGCWRSFRNLDPSAAKAIGFDSGD